MKYKMRSMQEIIDKIEELKLDNEDGYNSEMIGILEWALQVGVI